MQKMNSEKRENDFEPIGDPLAGSGFEQEQIDSEYSGDSEDEEANKK
jgi:hypothetical protein